jgi:FxsC-like protein
MHRLFISFDSADRDPYLSRFLDDIRSSLRSLPDAEVFVDPEITPGAEWTPYSLEAARTSQAMLSVCSPRYFNSSRCGREFAIFQRRIQASSHGAASVAAIFPMIWEPVRGGMPDAISRIQYSSANFPKEYLAEGLRYLAKLRTYRPAYQQTVQEIGRWIEKALHDSLLVPEEESSPEHLMNAFETSTDNAFAAPSEDDGRAALFSFAVGARQDLQQVRESLGAYGQKPSEWQPYTSPVGSIAQVIAAQANLRFREIPLWGSTPTDFLERLESANANLSPVIILADPWSMGLEPFRTALQRYDSLNLPTCAAIVPIQQDDETLRHRSALDSILRETLRYRMASGDSVALRSVTSEAELRNALMETITQLRLRRIEQSVAVKSIVDADLVREAETRGVTIGHLPVIRGPGGVP